MSSENKTLKKIFQAACLSVLAGLIGVSSADAGYLSIVSPGSTSFKPTAQSGFFDIIYTVPAGPAESIRNFQMVFDIGLGATVTSISRPAEYVYGANFLPDWNSTTSILDWENNGRLVGFGEYGGPVTVPGGTFVGLGRVNYSVDPAYVGSIPVSLVRLEDPRGPLVPIPTSFVRRLNDDELHPPVTRVTSYTDGQININPQTPGVSLSTGNVQFLPGFDALGNMRGTFDVIISASTEQFFGTLQVDVTMSAGMQVVETKTYTDIQLGLEEFPFHGAAESFFYATAADDIALLANQPRTIATMEFLIAPNSGDSFVVGLAPYNEDLGNGTGAFDITGLNVISQLNSTSILIPEPIASTMVLGMVGLFLTLRTRRRSSVDATSGNTVKQQA